MLWLRGIHLTHIFNRITRRHGLFALLFLYLLLLFCSVYFVPNIQLILEPYFAKKPRLETLRALLLTLGGSLIGASAIAFSLIMFAMQVNIERLPHGLFHKFSSDRRLLTAFGSTFVFAIVILTGSLFPDESWLGIILVGSVWSTFLIFLLFLFAYRRALVLVNPLQQLHFLYQDAKRQLRIWGRRADRAATILQNSPNVDQTPMTSAGLSTHDSARIVFFQLNPYWTTKPLKAMAHVISFSRQYAEKGDYEVSREALRTLVGINAAYILTKKETFFTQHLMLDNPMTTDGFINTTLEHLRQHTRIAVSRRDEPQIEQTFKTIEELIQLYLGIDYQTEGAPKYHAIIAGGYLTEAVQSVATHGMPDVLMEGIRLIGGAARGFLSHGDPTSITSLTEKIAMIASLGIVKEDHRPVTITGMEQLADLTFDLIHTKSADIGYAVRQIRGSVSTISSLVLTLGDTALSGVHSGCVAPYYSATSGQSLSSRLTGLVNAVVEMSAEDRNAITIIKNIEKWADGLYKTEKELLLAAIEKKSNLTTDIVHWIMHVTKILVAVSNAPACAEHTRGEITRHALWLISVLSWIPGDSDSVAFVQNYHLEETLFEAAADAHGRGSDLVSGKARDLLLEWTFKAGRHQTGWSILERGLLGLIALALIKGGPEEISWLKAAVEEELGKGVAPDQAARDYAASQIRLCEQEILYGGHRFSSIERAMEEVDQVALRSLQETLAQLLSPAVD